MRAMGTMEVTLAMLQADPDVIDTIKKVRKFKDADVAREATALVTKWKTAATDAVGGPSASAPPAPSAAPAPQADATPAPVAPAAPAAPTDASTVVPPENPTA